jgi:hypothetical protein
MTDLVGTCPKDFWLEWIAEGDAAGMVETGEEYTWRTRDPRARLIGPGDRFYIVAWGRLRGYAPVTRVAGLDDGYGAFAICRKGGAVAVTLARPIPGFRGLRERWWRREDELPFADWRMAGVAIGGRGGISAPNGTEFRPGGGNLPLFDGDDR